MVALGYWLKTPDTEWRRVTVTDYMEAATRAGLPVSPSKPLRSFKADGISGSTVDPFTHPPREIPRAAATGRTLTPAETAEIADRIAATFVPLVEYAQRFLVSLAAAIEPIARTMAQLEKERMELLEQEAKPCDQDTTQSTSTAPTPTPTGLGWPSKPASDVESPTGRSSTGSSTD